MLVVETERGVGGERVKGKERPRGRRVVAREGKWGEQKTFREGASAGKSETGKNGKLLWDHASVPAYLISASSFPALPIHSSHPSE